MYRGSRDSLMSMMAPATLAAFALVALPLILVPGPSVLFAVGRSLELGRAGGLLTVLGNTIGAFVCAVVVAVGVGVVIAQSPVLFIVIRVAGGLYLIYLGVQAIRHRNDRVVVESGPIAAKSAGRLVLDGFIVGVTNPKSIVFFLAVLPQFVDYPAGGVALQLLVLGTVFVLIAIVSDGTWALAASFARSWFADSPQRIARLTLIGGIVMILLGIAALFIGGIH